MVNTRCSASDRMHVPARPAQHVRTCADGRAAKPYYFSGCFQYKLESALASETKNRTVKTSKRAAPPVASKPLTTGDQ